ncbi:MAG TPA: hypothetical protein VHT75_13925 [Acidimicrobiales bacterium]|nr:hypothetical protein [Acidimicrobiales bacterium]
MASARTRRLRWSAPLLVIAVLALIAAIPGLSASAAPSLAPITPQDLIAKVQQTKVTAFSGELTLTTNLGIPNLGALSNATSGGQHGGQGFNPTDLLSGSHKALVWAGGPDTTRVALLQSMAETDVVHNGHDVWLWDSTTKKVTHYTESGTGSATSGAPDTANPAEAVKTPAQEASDLLAHLDPSTTVTVGASDTVADQDVYELILTPKAAASTVDHVAIAVDNATGFPLQVKVFAKGQTAAAVTLGFTKVSYSAPAASEFSFTPPPGSTVTNKTVGGTKHSSSATGTPDTPQPTTVGEGWGTVAIVPNVQIPSQLNQYLNAATPVSGAFGTGRVLSTPLVNVLVLNDGRVAVGAVNASALEAAIASTP